ncbi:phosphoribosylglycinamide formyltransferase [Herbaspirillum rubrisubalbicans]|uniref:phosphoribosylglycinamide formyltransferase n=1 Tax=Herbaspirillum rubrisubalbicans TaxID=80842 RepID=UPI000DD4A6BC|nr:formyltransferase family protein [Herbaspirillum rubrisubalbicans]
MGNPKLVFVGSSAGGVLASLLRHAFVRDLIYEVVSDRACGFLEHARACGLRATMLESPDGLSFSDALYQRYSEENLLFFSFYTRLFRGRFLERFKNRIFNCHPSLLPAFTGMRAFGDTLASSATFMGMTIHLVDEGMDSGQIVLQAALPLDRSLPLSENNHRLYLCKYYGTLQVLRWLACQRLAPHALGQWHLDGARYAPAIFSPNLDSDFFTYIDENDEFGSD